MKKITALLVSLIMSCAVMAGCSDSSSSSSSKADSTSKAETSAAADESTASEAGTATDLEDTLTAQYTKKIQGESLAIDMTVASEYDNSSAVVEISGGNMHMKMNFMGVERTLKISLMTLNSMLSQALSQPSDSCHFSEAKYYEQENGNYYCSFGNVYSNGRLHWERYCKLFKG